MAVRGYADWKPKGDAAHWVRCTLEVAEQFEDYLPLTVRQIFYRLVAAYGYPKTEQAYNRLTQIISRARRARYIGWDVIRDGGQGQTVEPTTFVDGDDFDENMRRWARTMNLDRQRGQANVVELWCEAGGMIPILEGIAAPYTAQVNTGSGYDSVTSKHLLAVRVAERARLGRGTLILHVGDFDPSGEDMCNVLREDAEMMVVSQVLRRAIKTARGDDDDGWKGAPWSDFLEEALTAGEPPADVWRKAVEWALGFFEVERVALTGEQVIERQVETAPPKATDSRMAEFVRRNDWVVEELGTTQISAQLEALEPPELAALVSGVIEERLDMDLYAELVDEEADVRRDVLARLDR